MSAPAIDPAATLAEIDLFSGLSSRQLTKVVKSARTVNHEAGRQIAAEGLGALAFHLVIEGTAKVSIGGREVRTLGPGDYFGEISMIDGRPRSATVESVGPLVTLAISHLDFLALVEAEPAFARGLLNTLCSRIREAEAQR
jgi:CRP-like cAMP-binding protein